MNCQHGNPYPEEGPAGPWLCSADGSNPNCSECCPDGWQAKAKAAPADPTPNPGSDAAIAQGCNCASMDNARGKGYLGWPGRFVITCDCPLHVAWYRKKMH